VTEIRSVCVYCGSSGSVDSSYRALARDTGQAIAKSGARLVYGGGDVGLMGETARAAHDAGGAVLGVIPEFLTQREGLYDEIEHRIVQTMHERKQLMFDESDAFIVLPGGIGTLEEAVETLSWMRLGLHKKPMAFLSRDDYWEPFFHLIDHIIEGRFTPAEFRDVILRAHSPAEALERLAECAGRMEDMAGRIPF